MFAGMDERYRAFTFVDRLERDETGRRIVGGYSIPTTLHAFPSSLVAEAVGQCAALSAMAAVDFRFRPVAGIAGAVEFHREARPGERLRLEATLVKADEEAVGYDGVASVEGDPVVTLRDCLGPMLPMEDFDDPEAVRTRYGKLLAGGGADADAAAGEGFAGLPALPWEATEHEEGRRLAAEFRVPEEGRFYADHFPRKPVFPGTLLMEAQLGLVAAFAEGLPGGGLWRATGTRDVKLRAFMPPGDVLQLSAELEEFSGDKAVVLVQSRRGRKLNSSARVELVAETPWSAKNEP